MSLTPRITIRGIPPSAALESHIQSKINKLTRFYSNIMHCDVVVGLPQKHKHRGNLYSANIVLTVPKGEITINHCRDEDIYVAIRDAFNAARRKLLAYAKQRRGEIKAHAEEQRGIINKLYVEDNFGFIAANDTEYYFTPSNVVNSEFNKLAIGDTVEFLEAVGGDGLQANHVKIVRHERRHSDL